MSIARTTHSHSQIITALTAPSLIGEIRKGDKGIYHISIPATFEDSNCSQFETAILDKIGLLGQVNSCQGLVIDATDCRSQPEKISALKFLIGSILRTTERLHIPVAIAGLAEADIRHLSQTLPYHTIHAFDNSAAAENGLIVLFQAQKQPSALLPKKETRIIYFEGTTVATTESTKNNIRVTTLQIPKANVKADVEKFLIPCIKQIIKESRTDTCDVVLDVSSLCACLRNGLDNELSTTDISQVLYAAGKEAKMLGINLCLTGVPEEIRKTPLARFISAQGSVADAQEYLVDKRLNGPG